ncbi:MAG: hypothetical protein ACLU77_05270 [Waltera sp.]
MSGFSRLAIIPRMLQLQGKCGEIHRFHVPSGCGSEENFEYITYGTPIYRCKS